MLPHCCGITDLNVHVGFEFKVTDRVEFDTADPPWQGFDAVSYTHLTLPTICSV